jgi:hypothetical protein
MFIKFNYQFLIKNKIQLRGAFVFHSKTNLDLFLEEEYIREFLIDGQWFIAKDLEIPDLSEKIGFQLNSDEWHEFSQLEKMESFEGESMDWSDFCDLLVEQKYDTYYCNFEYQDSIIE